MKDDFYYINGISCEGCKVCEIVCPCNAIRLEEKVSGDWYVADSKKHPFIYAHLRPGEENSGKLVSLVRGKARDYAKENNIDTIIIDGPPGIGCPVIASVGGVNLALIVTEPTQSGMHDLKRIFELTEHFKIPTCICINKFDLNTDITKDIEKFCEAKNVNVVGRVPYDVSVTKAMLQGLSIVEYAEGLVSEEIKRMWERLWKY
jgi:MinD superfamily P-loop ATPase